MPETRLMTEKENITGAKRAALELIVLFGIVSLFGDIIYEGARSVNGLYLKSLGANAAMVGLIAGLGEFLGYFIRMASGWLADRTGNHWIFLFTGYGLLCAVPLLALTGIWQTAALLMLLERLGKALRSPVKNTILSAASKQVGTGFGFGLNEALDQLGALLGPLVFSAVFAWGSFKSASGYKTGYALLGIPFILLIGVITYAYRRAPDPEFLENSAAVAIKPASRDTRRILGLYSLFTFLTTVGFVNFALLSFHFNEESLLSETAIPMLYAGAMALDGVIALLIGRLYDRRKLKQSSAAGGVALLGLLPPLSLMIALLGFSNRTLFAIAAILLWGAVMGIHETIMKSIVADIVPLGKRGTGYGIFYTAYGLAMLGSGTLCGRLYELSKGWIGLFSLLVELAAAAVLVILLKRIRAVELDAGLP